MSGLSVNLKRIVSFNQQGLVLSQELTKYFMSGAAPLYPEDVIEIIAQQLRSQPRDRTRSLSASSLPIHCERAGVFQWVGAKQNSSRDELRDAILNNLFLDGHWRHLRWQAVLLDSGLADTIEWSMKDDALGIKGTADAISFEHGYGIEIKGCHDHQFQILTNMKAPLQSHIFQVQAYMLLTGIERWHVLYENKNTNNFREFVVEKDEGAFDQIRRYTNSIKVLIERTRVLPDVLDECSRKEGAYKGCAYSDVCRETKEWPHDNKTSVSKSNLPNPTRRRGKVNIIQ